MYCHSSLYLLSRIDRKAPSNKMSVISLPENVRTYVHHESGIPDSGHTTYMFTVLKHCNKQKYVPLCFSYTRLEDVSAFGATHCMYTLYCCIYKLFYTHTYNTK